ncbi:MAG: Protein of unknown function rane [Thermoleophilia bacterium]|nr:Protein of unknown function rane [Thermoleophilia bacterium]MCZ4495757.1 Protein of unknown function rane [Thermoleophilia bacterium]
MTTTHWILTYAAGFVAFLAIDLLWLGVIARSLYHSRMGDLLADAPNWPIALLFYLLFVAGVLFFAVRPGLASDSLGIALRNGALLGLLTYATYDLTNLAVLRGFPAGLAFIDIGWGIVLTTSVSGAAWAVGNALR